MMKFLHLPSKSITGAAVVIAGSTLLSRLMGVLRDRVLTHHYGGNSPILDAYFAAFKIPDLIYNLLIIGALTAGFIPTFTKLLQNEDKGPAWKLANNILNIAAVSLIIVCTIGIITSPFISTIIAPGFAPSTKKLVITFTQIMFLSPFLLGISMVMGGILQSLRQFLLYSFAPLLYNLGIIIGVVILVPLVGTNGLAWGVVLGAFLHCTLQVYAAYSNGFKWVPIFGLKDKNTKLIGKLMLPRTLGLAVTQLNNVIITILASTLPLGSVTIYNLAHNLQGVPTGLIGIPFALAVFPVLSAAAANKNTEEFTKNLSSTIRQILFFIIPLSLIFLILRAQIVRVVYGSGVFDWDATIHTANTLAFFSLGLFAQSLLPLLARAFYALSDTTTPFVIGIISELISIIIAILLIRPEIGIFPNILWFHGVTGLAFASSLGIILNIVLLFIFLRRRLKNMEGQKLLTLIYKISLAGLIMGIIIQLAKYPLSNWLDLTRFWGILLQGLISGTMGLLVYIGICRVLRVEELNHIYQSLRKKWLKIRAIPEITSDQGTM